MNDVCKCSLMQDDELRFRAKKPTPFPIPEVRERDVTQILNDKTLNREKKLFVRLNFKILHSLLLGNSIEWLT